MRSTVLSISLLVIIALLAACQGEAGKIQSKVEDFLDEYIADGYDYDVEKYDYWDSTYSVSAESVADNKAYAAGVKHFKKSINYQPYQTGEKLIYVGVKYQVEQNGASPVDCKQTFYLDKDVQGVVCVKEN